MMCFYGPHWFFLSILLTLFHSAITRDVMRLSRKALSLGDIFAFTQMKSCISKLDWI